LLKMDGLSCGILYLYVNTACALTFFVRIQILFEGPGNER